MTQIMDKTFAAIGKLKEVEMELHRLKNALEMMSLASERKIKPEPILPGGGIGRHPDEALIKKVRDGIPEMPIKVQDKREENYKSFAQSAQVIGTQKKEWVGLTDAEIELLCEQADHSSWKAIELTQARLKEKNT